jgi:enamine deaminase RidA (YjgF/YER057c/UK114 family)
MPAIHLPHVDGLADIVGSAIASIGTGTRTVCISGQVGNTPDEDVLDGFRAQAEQAFRNLMTALEAAGASMTDVVKVNFYIVDWEPEKLGPLFEAAIAVFGDDLPTNASTLVGVSALFDPRWLIEIDAVAVIS